MTTTFLLERMDTPLGRMLLATDEQGRLRIIDWQDHEESMHRLMRRQYPKRDIALRDTSQVSGAAKAMQGYLEGDLTALDTLETATGGTVFQQAVWAALRAIPAGTTIGYLELATRIGRPKAVRAVGMANGANPISIVVPCHRVIGSTASLVGYGGGLPRKRWLLEHEGAITPLTAIPRTASLPGF